VGGTWSHDDAASLPDASSLAVFLDYRASLLFRI